MARVYNFSAGPQPFRKRCLLQAVEKCWIGMAPGMSVMEMSHRGKEFMSVAAEARGRSAQIDGVPSNYKVLFLQGGASSQFAMIPMNLIGRTGKADYFRTGSWSKKAISEAKRYGDVGHGKQ